MEEGNQVFLQERDGSIGYSFTVHDFPFRSPVRMVIVFYAEIDGDDGTAAIIKSKQNRFRPMEDFSALPSSMTSWRSSSSWTMVDTVAFVRCSNFRQICAGKRRMVGDCLENQGAVHVSYIFLISGTHEKILHSAAIGCTSILT